MNGVNKACTCPSGGASLHHPCPAHPPLADNQQGGRVRLGDQAERAPWRSMDTSPRDGTVVRLRWGEDHVSPGWWSAPVSPVQNDDGTWPSDTGGFPWAFIDFNNGAAFINHAVDSQYGPTHWAPYAALSAQPSPGGQDALERDGWRKMQKAAASQTRMDGVGACDALYELAVKHGASDAEAAGFAHHINGALALLETQAHDGLHRESAMEPALAARQPVEVSEGGFRTAASRQTASAESNATAEALIAAAARQPEGEPVTDAMRTVAYDAIDRFLRNNMDDAAYAEYAEHLEALWSALPAQAVDLGAVRKCADEALLFINHGYDGHTRRKIEELLALIDSDAKAQAVDLADFKALYRAYVRLLESGRDRIRDLGGTCDPVDVMEENDVDLQAARRVLDSQAVGK